MTEILQHAGLAISERVPNFFFSYARADWTPYLQRFFEDLRDKLAGLQPDDTDSVPFLDTNDIDTGQDFETRIAKALQVSKVLVSVYSPRYFSKLKEHEYCAKEFDVFLKRNPQTWYEVVIQNGQKHYRVRDARNIVPVLWYSIDDLRRVNDLPPLQVRQILYSLNHLSASVSDFYMEKGLSQIAKRRQTTYDEIVLALARLVLDLSKHSLPPLPTLPTFKTLRNPFWDPLDNTPPPNDSLGTFSPDSANNNAAQSEIATVIQSRLLENNGPRLLFAIDVCIGQGIQSSVAHEQGNSLPSILEEVATERRLVCARARLDPTESHFLVQVQDALTAASESNTVAILLVDSRCLSEAGVQDKLISLLEGEWSGGLLIAVNGNDTDALSRVVRFCGLPKHTIEQSRRMALRTVIDSPVDLRNGVISIIDEVVGHILREGAIHRRSPDNTGPDTKPVISSVR